MQLTISFFALLVATGAVGKSYKIELYEGRYCLSDWLSFGKKCTVTENQCCYDSKEFKSGKVKDLDSSLQFGLYEGYCDGFNAGEKSSGCLTPQYTFQSGKIYSASRKREESNPGPMELVEPDEVFMQERDYIYTIKRNSTEGEAYEQLSTVEDRAEHFRSFGERELIN